MEKDVGCVLRLMPLGEHGLIVVWCTASHGILRTAARHARQPGHELSGQIDLFHECELLYSLSPRSDLNALRSAALLNPRLPLRRNLLSLQLASYMSRLLLATVEPGSEDVSWYKLISSALNYLSESAPRLAILERFEQRLAELHGLFTPLLPPHTSLLQHFQHLPSGREDLVGRLRRG